MEISEEITKDRRIKKEKSRLRGIFRNIPKDKQKVVQGLIENAAFMGVSLAELQEIINEKGYTEEYQNGENQYGVKKASEVDIYNTMIKNYASVIKQLCDLAPESVDKKDKLMSFIAGGGRR